VKRVAVADGPEGLATDGKSVWVAGNLNGAVIRVDAKTGRVSGRVLTGVAPRGIAFGSGAAWVANSAGASVSRVAAG
jgi:streptogramin lyase